MPNRNIETQSRHSEDMQDIITAVPSWIIRWGTVLFLSILLCLLGITSLIRYPDIIKTQLKITSSNRPKPVIAKVSGKLVKLMVNYNQSVMTGQPLAYIESTAKHESVLQLLDKLLLLQKQLNTGTPIDKRFLSSAYTGELGELQTDYQNFIQAYLSYKSTVENGFLLQKRKYLSNDISSLQKQTEQLKAEKELQQRDFALAEEEYNMHKKLQQQKVETPSELRLQESKYLSRKAPLLQTNAAMISANTNLQSKKKEIMELDNQVIEERSRFAQALNSILSEGDDWRSKYVLSASQAGRVVFSTTIQQNQFISAGEDVFYTNGGDEDFFGEMIIPQENLGKVKEGQQVILKLKGYPFEQFGILRGNIVFISDVPYRDSVYLSKVSLKSKISDMNKTLHLKEGMAASAEIITEDATVLQRLVRNIIKVLHSQ